MNSISVVRVALEPIDDDTLERVIRQQLLRGQEYVGLWRLLALFQPVADGLSANHTVAACVRVSACVGIGIGEAGGDGGVSFGSAKPILPSYLNYNLLIIFRPHYSCPRCACEMVHIFCVSNILCVRYFVCH